MRKIDRVISFLLNNGNPSIKRRVKDEILHNLTPKEAKQYHEQILIKTNIRKTSCLSPSPISIERNGKPESYHLEYLEWFARCGVVPHIPALQTAVDEIADSIDEDGICRIPVSDDIFLR